MNLIELLVDTDSGTDYTTNGPLDNRLIDDSNLKHNFRYIDEIDIEVTKQPNFVPCTYSWTAVASKYTENKLLILS